MMLYDPKIAARIETDDATSSEFAEIIAAIGDNLHGQEVNWRIGDLLLKYCGPPGANGVRNGFKEKANRIIAELKEIHGQYCEVDHSYLEERRLIAHRFPPPRRLGGGVGWSLHQAARTPDNLKKAMAEAKRLGKPFTQKFVKAFVASLHADPDSPHWMVTKEDLRRKSVEKAALTEELAKELRKVKLTAAHRDRLSADLNDIDKADERSLASKIQIRKVARC